jgi:hypothetical protein
LISSWSFLVQRPESHMPLNWNFPAKIGPKTGKQVIKEDCNGYLQYSEFVIVYYVIYNLKGKRLPKGGL